MAAYELNQGENLLFEFNLLSLETGLTWRGVYDSGTAYVVDDALSYLNVVYKVVSPTTGNTPPNITFYSVLSPVAVADIASINAQLEQNKVIKTFWRYRVGIPLLSTVRLSDGLLRLELTKDESKKLSGRYDLRFELSIKDSVYVASGAQTDVICMPNILNVTPC